MLRVQSECEDALSFIVLFIIASIIVFFFYSGVQKPFLRLLLFCIILIQCKMLIQLCAKVDNPA